MCLALAAAVSTLAARQEPQYRGGTTTVSIYATALDEQGRLVTDLSAGDFEVFDDGRQQPLSVFANDLRPITIVVMLDRSGSMRPHFDRVRDAAEAFVEALLPADRARVGSFSNQIRIDPATFTSDRDVLVRILHEDLQDPGTTPLWNATALAMDALRHEEGRRVILVFTDGKDTPGFGGSTHFEDVRLRSQVEEVMVYGIGFSEVCDAGSGDVRTPRVPYGRGGVWYQRGGRRGPMGPSGPRIPGLPGIPEGPPIPGMPGAPRFPPGPVVPPAPRSPAPATARSNPCAEAGPDPELRELAAVGGGGYFELHSADDLRSTFARVADELHHQYLLAFTAEKLDNRIHQLEVRARRPGVTVRARHTYMAD